MTNKETSNFTKKCIKTALINLMGDKRFEEITITELVKKAGVSRTAFYRNYKTKDKILMEIFDSLNIYINRDEIKSELKESPKNYFLKLFTNIKEYKMELIQLSKAQIVNFNLFYRINLYQINGQNDYEEIAFYGAFIAVIYQWINNGFNETPEEMANLCCKIF